MDKIIQLIMSLFGSSIKKKITDAIMNVMLKGKSGDAGASGGSPLDILLGQFKGKGMADTFGSWVGTGENKPISPEQVKDVVGNDKMNEMAKQSGLSLPELAKSLSKYLPIVVDKMTPNGKMPGQ